MSLEAIKYKRGELSILDQLKLPISSEYEVVKNVQDAWRVTREMKIRGAPAIGVLGSLALAVDLHHKTFSSKEEIVEFITTSLEYLKTARPTGVNMADCAKRINGLVQQLMADPNSTVDSIRERVIKDAEDIQDEDVKGNHDMGAFGAEHIMKNCKPTSDGKHTVMTHCNTGALATAGYGTALGVIRALNERDQLSHAYCTETRPYNQGARLTAYELVHEKIPSTLITDSMVSFAMKKKEISAVVVGGDRIVANGDTANKIGTYQVALAAKAHGIPFYVAAPSTSCDLSLPNGDGIEIEERPHSEMTSIGGKQIAAEGIGCWNPAFDVTPGDLVTGGIITEFGVFSCSELAEKLKQHTEKKST